MIFIFVLWFVHGQIKQRQLKIKYVGVQLESYNVHKVNKCKVNTWLSAHRHLTWTIQLVTKRLLVQTPLWSFYVVWCSRRQGTLSSLSQSTQLKWGIGLHWELICDGPVFHAIQNESMARSHPLSTTEIEDKHRSYVPLISATFLTRWLHVLTNDEII